MVDGNNMQNNELFGSVKGGGILNTENSRFPSGRRLSSGGGDIPGIPLPSVLKTNHEVLMLIVGGETQSAIALLKSMQVTEVVGIRGLNLQIDDIEDTEGAEGGEESVGTLMWNPLHFAVYYQDMELLRFLIKEMKVNLALTAQKAPAESERDPANNEKYTEDKIMLPLLAYDRRNPSLLKYLLDEGFRVWPSKKTLQKLLKDRLLEEVERHCTELSFMPEGAGGDQLNVMVRTWMQLTQAILRSRTAHSFYGTLSLKKRTEWIRNLVYDLEGDGLRAAPGPFKECLRMELTMQPYCGAFLFFSLFEDFSDDHKAM
jgi:hypothetical protein